MSLTDNNGNTRAAEFIHETTWKTLPGPVKERVKLGLYDSLAAVIAGTVTRISSITTEYASQRMKGSEASILLSGKRSTAAGAALANGYAGNGLDIDDGSSYTRGHPGAQLIPALLAGGEVQDSSGEEFLTALAVGYEIAVLAGRCWHQHHSVYQACGSWGSVGCAAAASRIFGLGSEKTKHALGIAEYHAPNLPMMRDIDNPAMVKHGIGWGAMNGVLSAYLAAEGFTGIPSLFSMERFRPWVEELGSRWLLLDGLGIKRWCSCAWGHPALAAVEELQKRYGFTASEIDSIDVYTFHHAARLYRDVPKTTEEAQFSVNWPMAALLIDGEVGPDQMLEHRLSDRTIAELAGKITITEDREIDRKFRLAHNGVDSPEACYASRVVVKTMDGKEYDSGEYIDRYEWDRPKIEEKFRWITGFVLDPPRQEALIEMLGSFEQVGSVRELIAVLAR